jgi:hypothetical protein
LPESQPVCPSVRSQMPIPIAYGSAIATLAAPGLNAPPVAIALLDFSGVMHITKGRRPTDKH